MARWSQDVYLMHKVGITYKKLVDIKDYPDLGSDPELIETTHSSSKHREYIQGLMDPGSLAFTANYTKDEYDALMEVAGEGVQSFALYFGPTGSDGTFYWDGELSVWVFGKSVGDVAEMTINITVSAEIRHSDD